MAFEFKRLADVEAVEAVAAEANIIIEEDGQIKKVAKDQIGTKDAVKSVNGVLPDEAGNVVVEMPEIPEVEVPELIWDNIEDKPFGQEPNVALSWEWSGGVDEPLGKGDGGIIYDPDIFGARYDPQGKALLFTFSDGTTKLIEGIWETAGYTSTYTSEDFEFIINPNDSTTVVNIKDGLTLVKLEEPGAVIPLPVEFLPEHQHEVGEHTHSWNDLEDKPFGKKEAYIPTVEQQTGTGSFNEHETGNYIKISFYDLPNEATLTEGKTYKLVVNNTAYIAICETGNKLGDTVFYIEGVDENGYDNYVHDYSFSEKGFHVDTILHNLSGVLIYQMFVYLPADKYTEGEYTVSLYELSETITTLPAEFLPEALQIGENTTKKYVTENGVVSVGLQLQDLNWLKEGVEYTVAINNTEYKCTCKMGAYGMSANQILYLGNFDLDRPEGMLGTGDANYPFFIYYKTTEGASYVVLDTTVYPSNEAEIIVYMEEKSVTPLNEKYIPEEIQRVGGDVELTSPNGTKYKLSVSDDGTLSAVTV